ncbi:MAG: TetR/AcrR family transcriptional regulator [Pseudomonadota bacterium]
MQEQNSLRRSNRQRTRETKAALLKAARKLFVEKGYAETSTPEIVKAAGITRGALYHHYTDKEDLFRAVLHAEHETVAKEIKNSSTQEQANAIDALLLGSHGFLNAMNDKGRVRLMLLDGPAVLGRSKLDEIDRETSADELRIGLQTAMEAGEIRTLPLSELTAQLSAMFDRAALAIADGDKKEDHMKVFEAIFESLKV